MPSYRKSAPGAPSDYLSWEATGLRWLADVEGGARIVQVLGVDEDYLDLERLASGWPDPAAARDLGERLAAMHAAGAAAFGAPPDGWQGDGYFGPASEPLSLALRPVPRWGTLWAEQRIRPMVELGLRRGLLDTAAAATLERVASRCDAGDFDTADPPARIHGDLWSGNVMWTPNGAVLIDAAAHGGHRETDLAMLDLFGCPHLSLIVEAYNGAFPLADGWRERIALHQLHPLLVHVILFGASYLPRTMAAARQYA